MIIGYEELVAAVHQYHPGADDEVLRRAYEFSLRAHEGQTRESGDPFFSHPAEVAKILADMHLDCDTVVTGLLHDTVEDTDVTLADIEQHFGASIARLVDGVTKLSIIERKPDKTKTVDGHEKLRKSVRSAASKAENFRRLMLAVADDVRVLLVKLADRLHNMRTIFHVADEGKRRRIATETLDIYSALAACMGAYSVQIELEDLAFHVLNPAEYDKIADRLAKQSDRDDVFIKEVTDRIQHLANQHGIECTVSGRRKHIYSIWMKTKRRNVPFSELSDIMAFRMVVDTVMSCYAALGVLHGAFVLVPGKFKDYISLPKRNGYQSLHTTVVGPKSRIIEVQVRTGDMHFESERGKAAHRIYKRLVSPPAQDDGPASAAEIETGTDPWLADLLEIMDNPYEPEELFEHTRMAMFKDVVFCLTPKGNSIALPENACVLDFAYAVHSQIGRTCVGAHVNGIMRSLRTILKTGDQVSILTSKYQNPHDLWNEFVVTSKAKADIRRFLRQPKRGEFVVLGRRMLQKTCSDYKLPYSKKKFKHVLKRFHVKDMDELLIRLGDGHITSRAVLVAAMPDQVRCHEEEQALLARNAVKRGQNPANIPAPGEVCRGNSMPIEGLVDGIAMHYARCCNPIPGEPIVGIVTTGRGITIHYKSCKQLESFTHQPEREIDICWKKKQKEDAAFRAQLHVAMVNSRGAVGEINAIVSKAGARMAQIHKLARSEHAFNLLADMDVRDMSHLHGVIAALRSSSHVHMVEHRGKE